MTDFTEFASPSGIDSMVGARGYGMVQYGAGLPPAEFFMMPVRMGFKSEQAGYEIWEDIPFLRIFMSGGNVHERKATAQDKQNYSQHWAAFETGQKQAQSGTPLEMWPVMTPARVMSLKLLNIFTVQNLAEAPDTVVQHIGMGGLDLREKARTFVAAAEGNAPIAALQAENAQLKTQLDAMQKQMADIISKVEGKTGKKKNDGE